MLHGWMNAQLINLLLRRTAATITSRWTVIDQTGRKLTALCRDEDGQLSMTIRPWYWCEISNRSAHICKYYCKEIYIGLEAMESVVRISYFGTVKRTETDRCHVNCHSWGLGPPLSLRQLPWSCNIISTPVAITFLFAVMIFKNTTLVKCAS